MQKLLDYFKGLGLILLVRAIERSLGGTMDRDRKKVWWWVLIAALLILVIRLLSGCSSVPVQTPVPVKADGTVVHDTVYALTPIVLELDSTSRNDGIVECSANNVPYIRIKRMFFPDSMARLRRLLLIHENKHVEQGLKSGNCQAWRGSIASNTLIRFDIEAEAYCAVYNVEAREHTPHWWSKEQIAEFLRRTIHPEFTQEEAFARLPCLPP